MGTSIAQEKLVHKQCPNDEIGKLVRYECDVPAVVRSTLLSVSMTDAAQNECRPSYYTEPRHGAIKGFSRKVPYG